MFDDDKCFFIEYPFDQYNCQTDYQISFAAVVKKPQHKRNEPGESFLSPGTVDGIANGGEGGDTFVHAGVLQEAGKCTVTAHAVTKAVCVRVRRQGLTCLNPPIPTWAY